MTAGSVFCGNDLRSAIVADEPGLPQASAALDRQHVCVGYLATKLTISHTELPCYNAFMRIANPPFSPPSSAPYHPGLPCFAEVMDETAQIGREKNMTSIKLSKSQNGRLNLVAAALFIVLLATCYCHYECALFDSFDIKPLSG